MQQADFEGIFRAMAGVPVTIRLLDPPLHEFLPPLEEAVDEHMRERIRVLQEANPMLGMRGCRVGLIFPEIYEMQVRAIVRAARAVHASSGEAPLVEIMHPLVGFGEELRRLRELTDRVAAEEDALEYAVGTMIELPRACVLRRRGGGARRLLLVRHERPHADRARLLARRRGEQVPRAGTSRTTCSSATHSRRSTRRASAISCASPSRAAAARSPTSSSASAASTGAIRARCRFCHEIGLDYVSCSPYRVPLARLAAAQAALAEAGVTAAVAGG